MRHMTTAERRGFRQISDVDGNMMVIACDQRGAMRKILAPDPESQARIGADILGAVKSDIVRYLANYASCVLLDPVCALPKVVDDDVLGRATGLLVGLDDSGWDVTPQTGFRLSRLVPGITAHRVRELGGTGAKLLVYLRPGASGANDHNLAIIKTTVEDYAREDLLLVTEILTYPLDGEDTAEYAEKFPGLMIEGTRMALDHGAKVLKLPYPGTAEACRAITRMAGDVPWAVLSAGVDHATFLGQVSTAMHAGASGVIAGRALWKDCISLDAEVRRDRLSNIALPRLRELQDVVRTAARLPLKAA